THRRLPAVLIDRPENLFEASPLGLFQLPASQSLSYGIHKLHAAMVVACDQSVAYRFQSGLQPLPAFKELVGALVLFIERCTECVRDLFHIPLGEYAEEKANSDRRSKQERHQRTNPRIRGPHLFVA